MKVSKRSWHYKLNNSFGHADLYDSQCEYFWMTLWHLFLASLLCALFTLALCGVGDFIYSIIFDFGQLAHQFPSLWTRMPVALLIGAISCATIAGIFVVCSAAMMYCKERFADKINKHLNPLVEYLKAKKRKFCPTIEFVD